MLIYNNKLYFGQSIQPVSPITSSGRTYIKKTYNKYANITFPYSDYILLTVIIKTTNASESPRGQITVLINLNAEDEYNDQVFGKDANISIYLNLNAISNTNISVTSSYIENGETAPSLYMYINYITFLT